MAFVLRLPFCLASATCPASATCLASATWLIRFPLRSKQSWITRQAIQDRRHANNGRRDRVRARLLLQQMIYDGPGGYSQPAQDAGKDYCLTTDRKTLG